MQARRRAWPIRQRGREHFDSWGRKNRPHLRDTGGVGAIAVAYEQSFVVQPDDVSGFRCARGLNFGESRNAEFAGKLRLVISLDDPVRFARTHDNDAQVGSEGGVVRVSGIEGEVIRGGLFENLCADSTQLCAERLVLFLCLRKIGSVSESEFLPAGDTVELVPSRGSRRADQHSPEWTHHRVSIEIQIRLRGLRRFLNARHAAAMIRHGRQGRKSNPSRRASRFGTQVWQDESFNHLLRGDESLRKKVQYILEKSFASGSGGPA